MEWIILLQNNYLFILLGILILLILKNPVLAKLYKLEKITAVSAHEMLQVNVNKPVILDVRTPFEIENRPIIKRSRFISLSELSKRMSELDDLGKDRRIIVFCHSGRRSTPAGIKLKRAGFTNVYVMKGGLMAWKKGNFAVTKKKIKKKK